MIKFEALSCGNPANSRKLAELCQILYFDAGDELRLEGHHYRDAYLIREGSVTVCLDTTDENAQSVVRGPGAPVGEACFLKGCAATATVRAKTPGSALVIDDRILQRVEVEHPMLAANLYGYFADVAEQWQKHAAAAMGGAQRAGSGAGLEVYLCRNEAMLTEAFRLRYQVYCTELGRESPNADHDRKIIRDWLDDFGLTFIAVKDGRTVGTIRGNFSAEGSLGILEDWYSMNASIHHPHKTGVLTKFAVKKSNRSGAVAMSLIAAVKKYGERHDVKECYIDCIPRLLPFFRFFGFRIAGDRFMHYENGPSYPLMTSL